jgi:hypothetical protein
MAAHVISVEEMKLSNPPSANRRRILDWSCLKVAGLGQQPSDLDDKRQCGDISDSLGRAAALESVRSVRVCRPQVLVLSQILGTLPANCT